jgi:methylated-DNA-protein-cysteine methyltransferase related protein
MVPSPYFERIQRDIFSIMLTVPRGNLVTFKAVGEYLDVAPRHVAYILASVARSGSAIDVPWQRAVAASGKMSASALGSRQTDLLRGEGIEILATGGVLDLAKFIVTVADLRHGILRQNRPTDAPKNPIPRRW